MTVIACLAALCVGVAPAAEAAPKKRASKHGLGLPKRSCVKAKRVAFRVRAPRGQRALRVTVKVNGRPVRKLRGKRLRRRVTVRVRGKRMRVVVVMRTRSGRRLVARRVYRRCAAKAPEQPSDPLVRIPGCADDASRPGGRHPGGEWTRFNHDLSNTRRQPRETKIGPSQAAQLAPAWRLSVDEAGGQGSIAGTPIVVKGCVFAATNGGSVLAVNADTGKLVWRAQVRDRVSSLAYDRGRIYANVGKQGGPQVAAFDAATGNLAWLADVDDNKESELTGSPTPYAGMLLVGVSNFSFDKDPSSYYTAGAFRGSLLVIDQDSGRVLKRTYVISDEEFARGLSGGGIWSTPAVDPETGHAFVGTGNPTSPEQHPNTDALLKFDVDPSRPSFGAIVAAYRGTPDDYNPGIGDIDFGASPNLIETRTGRKLFGALQKSGHFHVAERGDAKPVWKQTLHIPTNGGNAATSASDDVTLYVPTGQQSSQPDVLYALDAATGAVRWATPGVAGSSYGPATLANDVVYMSDRGNLRGVDARSGEVVLQRSMLADGAGAVALEGGVAVARNTVYANGGSALFAYRPGGGGGGGGAPTPPTPTGGAQGPAIVAGPGAAGSGYLTPVMTIAAGTKASFANVDLAQHDVVAKDSGLGGLPLFRSKLTSFGATTPVEGSEKLRGGQYAFFCSIHPSMTGTLVVGG